MRPDRAYIRLQSGRKLDLLDPQPATWTNADLAVGLSRTYRWGGHSVWDLPLSVAQHSLLVLLLRHTANPQQYQRLDRQGALVAHATAPDPPATGPAARCGTAGAGPNA